MNMPRLDEAGSAMLIGEPREGGFYYIKSPHLPGFTFLAQPDEAQDVTLLMKAITPALGAYLNSYFKAQDAKVRKPGEVKMPFADLRGARASRRERITAELDLSTA